MNQELVIVGAGGHAKVVLSCALESAIKVRGFVDDNPALLGKEIHGYPVIGDTTLLQSSGFAAVLALGSNPLRKSLIQRYSQFKCWKTLIHPKAYVHSSVKLGEGSVVFAGAVIQPDAKVGQHSIVNTGTTVDHDCVVGDYVHLAPGVHLAGGVRVGDGTFLGIGSVAIMKISIGEWVTVGAGSVVISDIPTGKIVMGVPAKEKAT